MSAVLVPPFAAGRAGLERAVRAPGKMEGASRSGGAREAVRGFVMPDYLAVILATLVQYFLVGFGWDGFWGL